MLQTLNTKKAVIKVLDTGNLITAPILPGANCESLMIAAKLPGYSLSAGKDQDVFAPSDDLFEILPNNAELVAFKPADYGL